MSDDLSQLPQGYSLFLFWVETVPCVTQAIIGPIAFLVFLNHFFVPVLVASVHSLLCFKPMPMSDIGFEQGIDDMRRAVVELSQERQVGELCGIHQDQAYCQSELVHALFLH